MPDDTAVRNRDDAHGDARGRRKDGVFLVNTAKEVFTEVPTAGPLDFVVGY